MRVLVALQLGDELQPPVEAGGERAIDLPNLVAEAVDVIHHAYT